MDVFQQCLQYLRRATTDADRFGALIVIAKTSKYNVLSNSVKRELFHAIGNPFMKRLLLEDSIPEDFPPNVLRSLALSLLSSFGMDVEVTTFITDNSPVFCDILQSEPKTLEETVLMDNALLCINFATSDLSACSTLIKNCLLDSLIELYKKQIGSSEKALQVFLSLLLKKPSESWLSSEKTMTNLLTDLAILFRSEANAEIFDKANLLITIISTQPTVKDISGEDWIIPIQDTIYDVITSSSFRYHRTVIFKLASTLTERYGVSWFGLSQNERSCRLAAYLVHLASIEIRTILEGRSLHGVTQDKDLLLSCYHILECFISVSNQNMWELIHKQTEKMVTAITASINSVICFLISVSHHWNNIEDKNSSGRETVYATIRLLCSWLTEESLSQFKEVSEVLPFILEVAQEGLDDETTMETTDKPDILRLLLVPMCHLSADDFTRDVLMKNNVPELLLKYMVRKFTILCQRDDTSLEDSLSTVCAVLLNIVVMEGAMTAGNQSFNDLFKFLHYALPMLSSANRCLMLQGNFSVLGLLLAKHQFELTRFRDVQFHKFLSPSIKFLWNAHELATTSDYACLMLSPEYSDIWTDAMELWFLGLQALVSILPLVSWVAGFLLTSGWPQHIVQSFKVVPNENVDSSIKFAYQNFLCCLMKNSPDDLQPLVDQGIDDVARLHALKELESLLKLIQSNV